MKRLYPREEQNRRVRKGGSGRRSWRAILVPMLALLAASPVPAATLLVPQDYSSITAGLAAASSGDTVLVSCGHYAETDLVMVDGVVLRSETGTADCVTVSAAWLGRGITCNNLAPGTAIEGLTFTDGVDAAAGAVFCNHSTVTFRDCAFVHNYTGLDGAGFYCNESAPLLERCLFEDNAADGGSGGGFCSRRADPILRFCEFRNNRSGSWGGGFYASGTDNVPRLEKCVFSGNSALNGGAVAFKGTMPEMYDCEILDNRAEASGGGLYLDYAARVELETVRIEGNSAAKGKAGFVSGSSAIVLRCCTLDRSTLTGGGDITYVDDGCETANASRTWGVVKRLYR